MDTLGALDLLDPAHVHLVAGPALPLGAGRLRALRPPVRRHRGRHAEVRRRGRRCARSSATAARSTFMAPDAAQAHRRPAGRGPGALRRLLHARDRGGGGALPDAREGGRDRATSGPRSTSSTARPSSGINTVLAARRTCCASPAPAGGRRRAWSSRSSTTTAGRCRPGSRASSTCAGTPACSTSTTESGRHARRRRAATGSRWATWPTWTTRASYYICDRKRDMIISGGRQHLPGRDRGRAAPPPQGRGRRRVRRARRRVGRARARGGPAAPRRDPHRRRGPAFCRAHLAGYKVPREVSFHDVFPRDAAGKLLKRVSCASRTGPGAPRASRGRGRACASGLDRPRSPC